MIIFEGFKLHDRKCNEEWTRDQASSLWCDADVAFKYVTCFKAHVLHFIFVYLSTQVFYRPFMIDELFVYCREVDALCRPVPSTCGSRVAFNLAVLYSRLELCRQKFLRIEVT